MRSQAAAKQIASTAAASGCTGIRLNAVVAACGAGAGAGCGAAAALACAAGCAAGCAVAVSTGPGAGSAALVAAAHGSMNMGSAKTVLVMVRFQGVATEHSPVMLGSTAASTTPCGMTAATCTAARRCWMDGSAT
jgi:hypothetical protein